MDDRLEREMEDCPLCQRSMAGLSSFNSLEEYEQWRDALGRGHRAGHTPGSSNDALAPPSIADLASTLARMRQCPACQREMQQMDRTEQPARSITELYQRIAKHLAEHEP